jgi:hypothetical protein
MVLPARTARGAERHVCATRDPQRHIAKRGSVSPCWTVLSVTLTLWSALTAAAQPAGHVPSRSSRLAAGAAAAAASASFCTIVRCASVCWCWSFTQSLLPTLANPFPRSRNWHVHVHLPHPLSAIAHAVAAAAAAAAAGRGLLGAAPSSDECLVAEAVGINGLVSGSTGQSWGSVHVQALSHTMLSISISLAEGRRFQVVSDKGGGGGEL